MASEASASASTVTADVPNYPDFTKGQVRYTAIVAFIAWTMAVYDLITFGNLLPAIQKDFGWSDSTASFVATFVSFGSLVVALAVGPMIDFLGRRTALFVTTGGAAISSGLAALAFSPLSLALFRSLSGFRHVGAGGELRLSQRSLRRAPQGLLLRHGAGGLARGRDALGRPGRGILRLARLARRPSRVVGRSR